MRQFIQSCKLIETESEAFEFFQSLQRFDLGDAVAMEIQHSDMLHWLHACRL